MRACLRVESCLWSPWARQNQGQAGWPLCNRHSVRSKYSRHNGHYFTLDTFLKYVYGFLQWLMCTVYSPWLFSSAGCMFSNENTRITMFVMCDMKRLCFWERLQFLHVYEGYSVLIGWKMCIISNIIWWRGCYLKVALISIFILTMDQITACNVLVVTNPQMNISRLQVWLLPARCFGFVLNKFSNLLVSIVDRNMNTNAAPRPLDVSTRSPKQRHDIMLGFELVWLPPRGQKINYCCFKE